MGLIVVKDPQTGIPYTVNISGDTPTESETQKIQSFFETKRQPIEAPIDPTDDKSGTALGRGASVGIDVLQQMYGSALEGVGKVTGIEGLRDYGASVVEANQEEIEEKQKAFTQRQDVGSVGDAFSFYGETLGQNLPQLGTSIGAGLATQALLPFAPGVGFLVGALASNIPFFYGSHRERQKEAIEQGKRTELDEGTAFMYSLPSAALDTVVDKFLVGLKPLGLGIKKSAISPSVGGFFTKVVDKSMVGSVAARATMGATAGAATEIPTEIGQQLIERYQAGLPIDDDEAVKEYIDVAIAAGLVGGTVRGTTNALTGKGKAALAKEELDKDIQAEGLQAEEMAKTQKDILDRGFIEADPLQIGFEEGKTPTKPSNTSEETIAKAKAATESQTPFREIDIKTELDKGEQDILERRRKQRGLGSVEINPNTTIAELESLVEPTSPGVTDKFKKKLKPYLSNLPSHSLNFVQNHSESQYNAVSDFFKNKESVQSVDSKDMVSKIKDILVEAKQTDENNVVTDKTASSISDKLVKDGKIVNIFDKKTGSSSFLINKDTFIDAKENEIKRARQLLEAARDNYEKTESNLRRVEQNVPMLGKKNVLKNTAKIKAKDNKISELREQSVKHLGDIDRLSKRVDSLVNARQREKIGISPTPNTISQTNVDQVDANQSRITVEKATAVDNSFLKKIYTSKRNDVLENLKKYLKEDLKLSDVSLVANNVIGSQGVDLSQKDYVVEGEFSDSDSKRVISLSMELYDPNMSQEQYERKLKGVLNHEVIHAVKSLGLFTDGEYKSLVKAATEREYVFKDGKKLLKRNYTYLDRAKRLYPDLDQSGQEEEAIAELFRDTMDGKIKLAGKPRTLLQRFKDFFKSIFKAHSDNGFRSVDDIFEDIKSGEIGRKDRGVAREYLNSKESPVAQKTVDSPESEVSNRGLVKKSIVRRQPIVELFESMGEDGALVEYPDIGSNLMKYILDNDRNALAKAFKDNDYNLYDDVLKANLRRVFPSGEIDVQRIENYTEFTSKQTSDPENLPTDRKIYTYKTVKIDDVKFVGNDGESELVVLDDIRPYRKGAVFGDKQLISYSISKDLVIDEDTETKEEIKRSVKKFNEDVPDNTLYHNDLSTEQLITGWIIEPRISERQSPQSTVSRQEVYDRLLNDTEFQKASTDALREKGFTDTVTFYRLIYGPKENLNIQNEQLISGTIDPLKFFSNYNFLTEGKVGMGDETRILKYTVPMDKVGGYLPSYYDRITPRSVNKKAKEKGFAQRAVLGDKNTIAKNPAEKTRTLLNLQDEILADVSDIQPEVLRDDFGTGTIDVDLRRYDSSIVIDIVKGKVVTGKDYRSGGNYITTQAEPIKEQQLIDRINNFFGTNQEVTTEPTKKSVKAIKTDVVPDTPTLFDIAPQEDMEKLSNVMDSMEKQVVTPRVKYSRRAVKPADPEIMREIPIDFTKAPDTYKRQLSESMLRYAYGYVRETNGNVIPITFKEGDNVVLEDGREGGYGAWHITSRGHDIELREATKQEPDRVIYTMLRKMVEQEYGNGQPGTIVIEPSTRGNDFDITWANNRPKKYPPIKLSLMYQAPTETLLICQEVPRQHDTCRDYVR
jgi:hypothetical protein